MIARTSTLGSCAADRRRQEPLSSALARILSPTRAVVAPMRSTANPWPVKHRISRARVSADSQARASASQEHSDEQGPIELAARAPLPKI